MYQPNAIAATPEIAASSSGDKNVSPNASPGFWIWISHRKSLPSGLMISPELIVERTSALVIWSKTTRKPAVPKRTTRRLTI